jgi:site-specific DNA-methyltransferase (adenine-specific)
MAKKIVVSVKSGERVNVAMVRDLKGVVEREKAAIGLFVTLASPTKPMQTEAVAAGFYSSPYFKQQSYPRLQILTIEGLLNRTEQPRHPDMSMGAATFKKAPKKQRIAEQVEVF